MEVGELMVAVGEIVGPEGKVKDHIFYIIMTWNMFHRWINVPVCSEKVSDIEH